MKKRSLLIVDDMIPVLDLLSAALSKKYDLVLTTSLCQAKALCAVIPFDYVLTDVNLSFEGNTGGYDLIEFLISINFSGKIGIMSGYFDETPDELKNSITFKLEKPFILSDLLKKLELKL